MLTVEVPQKDIVATRRKSTCQVCRNRGLSGTAQSDERNLLRLARPGDLVLTLGAGSVTDVGPLLLALLEDR